MEPLNGFVVAMRIYAVKWIALVGAITLTLPSHANAARIPDDVKRCVAFVFTTRPDGSRGPGTGFFVGVKHPEIAERWHVYFVTARHVLQRSDHGPLVGEFTLRMNSRRGVVHDEVVPVIPEGLKKNLFVHADPSVDLAVLPLLPNREVIDFLALPDSMVTDRDAVSALHITEGTEVFFAGLFKWHLGSTHNRLVVRFGRVAMLTDEKIDWNGPKSLYVIDAPAFGGNSGAPVFFFLGLDRTPGATTLGPPQLRLAGVMMGAFTDTTPGGTDRENMGIAAVTPAHLLRDILFSDELRAQR